MEWFSNQGQETSAVDKGEIAHPIKRVFNKNYVPSQQLKAKF
jgi:hypothetical protein